jgi:hypothetical protein
MTDRLTQLIFLTAIAACFIFFMFLVGVTAVMAYLTWGSN